MRAFIIPLLIAAAAHADDPKYEYKDPTKASVDVKKPTVWKANSTLGLSWLDGNAESVGCSATGSAGMKHWNNELSLTVGGAYVYAGIAKFGPGGPVTDKRQAAGNWNVRLRYDRYFYEKNT